MPARYIFAADLGGTKCAAAVIDRHGQIVRHSVEPVDISSPSGPVRQICRLAEELAPRSSPATSFSAMAVAVPGLVRRNGTVWAPNLLGWERMPLCARLQRELGIPVMVESDRNAAVLGECWRGIARGRSDLVVLIIGTGIGAGIMSGGHLVRGAHELSGCAGWMSVFREQTKMANRVGQLESLCSGAAVARIARACLQRGRKSSLVKIDRKFLSAKDVAAAARNGDRLARDIFAEMGTALGYAVADIVSLFDPEIIVLAGGMAKAADLYMKTLKDTMLSLAQPLSAKQVRIAVTKLGEASNLLGCASLAWQAAENGKK